MKKQLFLFTSFLFSTVYAPPPKATTAYRMVQQIFHRHRQRPISIKPQHNLLFHKHPFLNDAVKQFSETPGFAHTLRQILTSTYPEGHIFEVETAVNLTKSGHTIIAFSHIEKMPNKKKKREFDLIASIGGEGKGGEGKKEGEEGKKEKRQIWIECKNSRWSSHSLKKQFREQNAIVLAKSKRKNISYKVHSKRHIPDDWCLWFSNQGIEVDHPPL